MVSGGRVGIQINGESESFLGLIKGQDKVTPYPLFCLTWQLMH
jgi:hypothetical protein